MENPIFVKRGELIFLLRKNAKIWGITYPRMRLFIQRLKKKKMINIRLATMNPIETTSTQKSASFHCKL